MYDYTQPSRRQRELLDEAARDRLSAHVDLVRRCRMHDAPSTFRILATAILGREPRPIAC